MFNGTVGFRFLLLPVLLLLPLVLRPSRAQGAPTETNAALAPGAGSRKEFQLSTHDRAHWAFQKLLPPAPPVLATATASAGLASHPIDAFIAAKLRTRGLAPNPSASRRELIRRATYDLTGLPPSPAEVEAFLADQAPQAWENLIDRLLASPHYGEKWGRHWLDLVRFAESNSYERDGAKPHAWRFRDYVIRAFNADKPYDRFVWEQLAGDELPEAEGDAVVATGFYRLGIWDDEPADRELARFDALDDIVSTTGQVFLGLTVDCARCHNHKLDPIPQADYYRLLSFFHGLTPYQNGGATDELPYFATREDRLAHAEKLRKLEAQRSEVQAALALTEQRFLDALAREQPASAPRTGDQRKVWLEQGARLLGTNEFKAQEALRQRLESLKPETIPTEKALAVTESGGNPPDTFVLLRGNPASKGDKVEPGFLQVLGPLTPPLATPSPSAGGAAGGTAGTRGRRTRLAQWITSPDNPLTARVMANRVWQHHFGRGLVRSPNNFGLQGEAPTHPELLDWLAREWIAQGWRLKPLHRLIMTSEAYRRASHSEPRALAADPVNDLFWRFDMRRLTAEEIRDTILAVNGSLNLRMFGPSLFVDIPKEVLAGQSLPGNGWGKSSPEDQARRSVYIFVKRSLRPPILEAFDVAETDRSAPVRFVTVQPTQALGLLNGPFLNHQAEVLAGRLRREAGAAIPAQVRLALQLVTGRPPTDPEIQRGISLAHGLEREDHQTAEEAMKYFCLMALNLNEMIYLD